MSCGFLSCGGFANDLGLGSWSESGGIVSQRLNGAIENSLGF